MTRTMRPVGLKTVTRTAIAEHSFWRYGGTAQRVATSSRAHAIDLIHRGVKRENVAGNLKGSERFRLLAGLANFAARLIPRSPRCKIPMNLSPRRLSNIVAGSRLQTQGFGQFYAGLRGGAT